MADAGVSVEASAGVKGAVQFTARSVACRGRDRAVTGQNEEQRESFGLANFAIATQRRGSGYGLGF